MFNAAFPDKAQPMTVHNIAKGISAYERTLLTPSPFDAYLAGNRLERQCLADDQTIDDDRRTRGAEAHHCRDGAGHTHREAEIARLKFLRARTVPLFLIQCEHPDRSALRHIRELPWPLEIEACLHPRCVDTPSRLHGDILLSVELE